MNATMRIVGFPFPLTHPLPPGVASALNKLKTGIANDPDCSKFLGSGAAQQIDGMLQNASGSVVGTTTIPPNGSIVINAASNGYVEGQGTTLNNLGAFYKPSYNGSALTTNLERIGGGSPTAQAFILLHEIAHLMNDQGGAPGFGPDYSTTSTVKVDANDNLLNKNCAKAIKGL